jgi:hypothetical protein
MMRPEGAPRALGPKDEGQMMILGAIVLILGLVALAAMVSQVGQLAGQAGREQDRPLLREVEPMVQGLNTALTRLSDPAWSNLTAGSATYTAAVAGLLDHLRLLEASRGFVLDHALSCQATADPNVQSCVAVLGLTDGELCVEVRSQAVLLRNPAAAPLDLC